MHELQNGNINIAVPWMVNIYNDRHKTSFDSKRGNILRVICWHWYHGRYSSEEKCQMVGGDYISTFAAAKTAYKSGQRTQFIKESFADGVLYDIRKKLIAPEDEKIAVDMMRALITQGINGHDPHHILGEYFTIKYNYHDVDKKEFDRGMAHLIYHSKCNLAAYWVTYNYLDAKKSNDLVKGVAAAQWALPMNDGLHEKWMKKWLARSLKKLSPEEKKEAQKLVDEGFPHADKFRKQAFEYLQRVGDIPADRPFKKKQEEEEELEEISIPAKPQDLISALTLLLMLPEAAPQPLFTEDDQHLFTEYLAGKQLGFNKAKRLVILLTKNDKKLQALLKHHEQGKHAARVKELRSIIGHEHELHIGNTPLAASVGWYLTYRGDKVMCNPYVTRLGNNGPSSKAGLQVGDMIDRVNGVDTRHLQARNLFVRLVSCWPKGLPMHLQVKRGKFPHRSAGDSNPKTVTKKFQLVLPKK
ncbi:hypothetical protein JIN77_06005 [Verrucomicrobiaceae bacterium R5-34]|nr:hypothetical protein [Verrucomicrobiaceae bacterium R5-34]